MKSLEIEATERTKTTLKARSQRSAAQVHQWLTSAEAKGKKELGEIQQSESEFIGMLPLMLGIVSCCGLAKTTGSVQTGALLASIVALVTLGISILIFQGRRNRKKAETLRSAKKREIASNHLADPFYQRAKLITGAVAGFEGHCDRYEAWRELVNNGLEKPDEKAADEYYAKIERWAEVRHPRRRRWLDEWGRPKGDRSPAWV